MQHSCLVVALGSKVRVRQTARDISQPVCLPQGLINHKRLFHERALLVCRAAVEGVCLADIEQSFSQCSQLFRPFR